MKLDLILKMKSKIINFDYTGGEKTQNFNIRGTNLPWSYECEDDWIGIKTGATSLNMDVRTIYDFNTRSGLVKVFDRFRNELDLIIQQTGYQDLSIEMPTKVVLYEDYYENNDTYDVYLTVYGGPQQMVDCEKLQPYIEKVWDNSNMYNDFLLRIPKTLEGTFTVRHSDAKSFMKFCQENGLKYPKEQMEKKLTIAQITKADVIGEMIIEYNGERYTNNDEIKQIDVCYDKPFEIEVISNKFTSVISKTEYKIVENSPVEITVFPDWLDVKKVGRKFTLQCKQQNMFADRYSMIKLVNTENINQYITINIKQETES